MTDENRGKDRSFIHKRSNEKELRQSSATGRSPGARFDDLPQDRDEAESYGIKVPAGSPEPMTLEQMGDYLRCLTQESGNRFKISNGSGQLRLKSSGDGSPVKLNTGRASDAVGADEVFDTGETGHLDTVHGTTNHFANAPIENLINPGQSGHDVLRDIVPSRQVQETPSFDTTGQNQFPDSDLPKDGIQEKVSAVLNNNRFNSGPSTPFAPSGQTASSIDARPFARSQAQLGVYDNSSPANITYEDMKKLGLTLMLRATGEFVEGDPTNPGVSTAALLPGSVQALPIKLINPKSMWASDLTEDEGAPPELGRDKRGLGIDLVKDNGMSSFGTLNNHLEPFGGVAPIGMVVLGAALVVAVKLAIEGLFAALGAIFSAGDTANPRPQHGPFTLGKSGAPPSEGVFPITLEQLGFVTINHDYITAVNKGIDIFFGGVEDLQRVGQSPGYYAVLVRAIIRSSGRIIEGIVDAVNAGSPVDIAQSLLGIVDIFRSSKVVAFTNVLATLGDRAIELEAGGFLTGDDLLGFGVDASTLPDKISTVDRLTDGPVTRVMKSRSKRGLELAWRNAAPTSLMLLPESVVTAQLDLASPTAKPTSLLGASDLGPTTQFIAGNRIPGDVAANIEDSLESEYVPFYFHDLRTNEIIAFHAFLSALGETYAVNYESDEAYGRVDPVMVYRNTRRTVNLTFWCIATNEGDFDQMWVKINKLMTMLYPQWSPGRLLEDAASGATFTQPFSQIPTASPLIRLRIGDVIKSNYSKFALARIFGLGTPDFDDGSGNFSNAEKIHEGRELVNMTLNRQRENPLTTANTLDAGFTTGDRCFLRPASALGYTPIAPIGEKEEDLNRLVNNAPVKVNVVTPPLPKQLGKTTVAFYEVEIDKPEELGDGYDIRYLVTHDDLMISIDDVFDQLNVVRSEVGPPLPNSIQDFFSSDNNAIVRSFESTAGRGLAGFITNLTMDLHAPRWETNRWASRAPQWVQITLSFSPVHDIAPGIAADGFNRAPIYNVGELANKQAGDPFENDFVRDDFEADQNAIAQQLRPGRKGGTF